MKLRKRNRELSPVHIARIQCEKNEDSNFFKIVFIDNYIGYGVFAMKEFSKGDFLLEYSGDLLTNEEGKQREKQYSEEDGSFLFFFLHNGKEKCIDATKERNRAGRMVNDSDRPNAKMRVVEVSGTPHLCLFAVQDIANGEELRYDYGVRDLPWRLKPFSKDVEDLTVGDPSSQNKSQTGSCSARSSVSTSGDHLCESAAVARTEIQRTESPATPSKLVSKQGSLKRSDNSQNTETYKRIQSSRGSPACLELESGDSCFEEITPKSRPSPARECNIDKPTDDECHDNEFAPVEENAPEDLDCSQSLTGAKVFYDDLYLTKGQSAFAARACYGYDSDLNPFEWSEEEENSGKVQKRKSLQTVGLQSSVEIGHSAEKKHDNSTDLSIEEDPFYGYNSDFNPFEHCDENKTSEVVPNSKSPSVDESDENQFPAVQEDVVEDSDSAVNSSHSRFNFEYLETPATRNDSTLQVPIISSSFQKRSRPLRVYDSSSSEESSDVGSDVERFPTRTRKKRHVEQVITSSSSSKRPSSSISVMRTHNEKSKRIWDRQNYCIYCNKSFSKLPRHFETKHSREIEVAQILSKTKGSKERKWMWSVLENKGNHVHNTQVLSKGQGTLVPAMRQSSSTSANDYLPCEHCLGYYIRHDLWKHKKRCPSLKLKGVDPSKGRTQGRSALLLPFPKTSSEAFSHHVLGKMNSDEIGLIVRQDDLILKFGLRMFMKLSEPHQYQYISQKMRMLGRLVLTMRELSGSNISSLEDAVCPRQFKNVTEAVRHVAGFDPVKKLYQTPSLALKIGHSLKACAAILKGEALQSLDKVGQEAAESFEDLCSLEWNTEVSHHALGTLAKRHWNKPQNLPLGEDVVKLNRHLKKVAQDNAEKLCKDPSDTSAWYELSKATLCQLILFNRRRAGEVERLLVEECSKITDEMNSDILNSLSEWEQNLCKKLMRLEIRGKRGRRVPVLMTQALHTNVRNLISARSRVNVSESNIYLFARPFPSPHSLRGHDCIRQFSIECNVSHPENLTSTKLRKQIGTMSQVFNLQNNELDILATFMGHDINVHRDFYRLPEQTLQLVKVSRILLAMEQGKLTEFKGKALDDIEIDVDGDDEDNQDETEDSGSEHEDMASAESPLFESDVHVSEEPSARTCRQDSGTVEESPLFESDVHVSEEPSARTCRQDSGTVEDKRKPQKKKKKWTSEETTAVLKHLRRNIILHRVPGKDECMRCIEKEPALHNREWRAVKYKIYNLIQKQKGK